jgi:hypothetical protein
MIMSLFFLLFQIIMIIDLCYLWGVRWVQHYDEGNNAYMYLLIITTIILYAGTIYFIAATYSDFGGCGSGSMASTVNLIFTIVAVVLIFVRLNPDGSLLTSGAVSLITSYLTWSGLSNMDSTEYPCNTLATEDIPTIVNLVVGVIIIIVSMVYVSVGSSESTSGQVNAGGVNVPQAVLASPPENEGEELRQRLDEEEPSPSKKRQQEQQRENRIESQLKLYEQSNSFIYFHIIMLFASCYIAMLLTNWGNPVIDGSNFTVFKASNQSMWSKLGTSWVAMALYVWTLVAPRLFPDRDFS